MLQNSGKGTKIFSVHSFVENRGPLEQKTDAPPPEHPVSGGGARGVYGEKRAVCHWQTAENETIWKKNKKMLDKRLLEMVQ